MVLIYKDTHIEMYGLRFIVTNISIVGFIYQKW